MFSATKGAGMNFKPIPNDQIPFALDALRRMMFIRAFEQRCWDLSISKTPLIAGSVHLCAGQEAIPVGACAALTAVDRVIATYRGHGWALEAGLDAESVFAEICHRESGVNGGRAGSAFMMGDGGRFVGENSIVGAGGPIANGVALALKELNTGGVAVVSFGDGAMNQGALHEAFVLAVARKLPVIFVCENNGWSELTPTSRIVPFERMSRRGNGYGMPSATIDGCDPLVVQATIKLAADKARNGDGPSLIECSTVRLWGHYNKDVEHYRPRSDRELAAALDPITVLKSRLEGSSSLDEKISAEMKRGVDEEIDRIVEAARNAPLSNPNTAHDHVTLVGYEQSKPSTTVPEMEWTYQQAINEALRSELQERPEVVIFGEDVGQAGGIFGCTRNLQKEFGEARVFDTPIAEAAILGAAVGCSLSGMRPVAEIMWMDFMLVALDQLINQAANVRYITRGKMSAPLVVRVQQGATPGSCAQHSQSLEAILAHIPGLKVGLPSSPQEAYSMLRAAIADPDPCIIIESRELYQTKGPVTPSVSRIGTAMLRRKGKDLAIISWGAMVNRAEEAAKRLSLEGIDASVLDMRWLSPLDVKSLVATVQESGRVALVVHEANLTGGFGAEIAARLLENGLPNVRRLASPDIRVPASPILQKALLPDEDAIVLAARAALSTGEGR
jgi:2-oxoisovalerate dehydrogenase E1 component